MGYPYSQIISMQILNFVLIAPRLKAPQDETWRSVQKNSQSSQPVKQVWIHQLDLIDCRFQVLALTIDY